MRPLDQLGEEARLFLLRRFGRLLPGARLRLPVLLLHLKPFLELIPAFLARLAS